MHSGFFLLKTFTIAEQKKLHIQSFLWPLSFKKKSQVTMTKWSQSMLVPDGSKPYFFSSQNHIEILVLIILGIFPVNKTQK
jgi:hypothetical protein